MRAGRDERAERVGRGTRRLVWWDGALWWRTYEVGGFDGYRTLRRRLACGALAQRMGGGG